MAPSRQPQAAPANPDPYHGILLVDKPSGPTSHDLVKSIRQQFQLDKVGHAGTLDPQATGLLIIMIGRATKLANALVCGNKSYQGVFLLGTATDSQDGDGRVIQRSDFSHVTREDVLDEMRKRTGDLMQTPPMVSAVKHNGVPLYKLARKGKEVKRLPKLIHIFEFTLLNFSPPRVFFSVRCTKGVYIRTLCADIGQALGCGAYLAQLRRVQSGKFNLDHATTFEDLLQFERSDLLKIIIPLHQVITTL